jgi:hypothetical protein
MCPVSAPGLQEQPIEHAPRESHTAPTIDARAGESHARFVLAFLLALGVGLGLVAAANAIVDPYGKLGTGLFPTATFSDRRVKVGLIDRLRTPPRLVVLGSSRAMKAEPSYLQAKTGLPGFNAAVTSGKPEDAWAFANLLHDRFPGTRQSYLWLLDVEAFRSLEIDPSLRSTPQLSRYLPSSLRAGSTSATLESLVSWYTAEDSWAVVKGELQGRKPLDRADFAADGFRSRDFHDLIRASGTSFRAQLDATITQWVQTYRVYKQLGTRSRQYFQQTVAAMNRWGATPVIVLPPMQPQLLRRVRPLGWDQRHRQVLAYLHGLQQSGRYRFRLIDDSEISAFGGTATDFYDGVHMTTPNMRRLLDQVLARDRDALQ